jgi:hypothetical protein
MTPLTKYFSEISTYTIEQLKENLHVELTYTDLTTGTPPKPNWKQQSNIKTNTIQAAQEMLLTESWLLIHFTMISC